MATRLKLALFALILAGTAVAIQTTEPEAGRRYGRFADGGYREWFPLRRELMQARSELVQLERRKLVETLISSSASPFVVRTALPDSAARVSRDLALAELAAIAEPKSVVKVLVVGSDFGADTSGWRGEFYNPAVEIYARRNPPAYCAVVARAGPDRRASMRFLLSPYEWTSGGAGYVTNVYGPCRFWAKYGAPGPQIHQWLRNGGYHFANGRAEWLGPLDRPRSKALFAGTFTRYSMRTPQARRCLAGLEDGCLAVLVRPTRSWWYDTGRTGSVADFVHHNDPRTTFGPGDAALLAHVERDFGAERFQRFWSSPADVPTAFEAAFGARPAQWLLEWGRAHYGVDEVGPRLGAASVLLSVLTIGILITVAVQLGLRRRAG